MRITPDELSVRLNSIQESNESTDSSTPSTHSDHADPNAHSTHETHTPSIAASTAANDPKRQMLTFIVILVVLGLIASGVWAFRAGHLPWKFGVPASQQPQTHITIGTPESISSLDISSDSARGLDQALLANVYETLVGRDVSLNPAPTGIAEKWNVSEDGLTYTFTLHQGIRFSNGHVLDANDVVWSIQQVIQNQFVNSSRLKSLTQVEAQGGKVIINLKTPDPDFLWALSTRAGIVYDSEATYDKALQAVGSGPFTVENFSSGKSMDLVARADYWGSKKPETERITLSTYADVKEASTALINGKLDALIPVAQSPQSADLADVRAQLDAQKSNITVTATPSSHKWAVAFNNSADSLFSDTRMRQAFRTALNSTQLISSLGISARPLAGPIASTDPGYEDLTSSYPYNLAQAKKLAAFFLPPVPFKFVYPSRYGDAIGQEVANQFKSLGMSITVTALSDEDYKAQVIDGKQFDITIVDFAEGHDLGSILDPQYFISYTSSRAENAWSQASTAVGHDAYVELLRSTAKIVAEDAPFAWAFEEQPLIAVSTKLSGLPSAGVENYLPLTSVSLTK